MTKVTLMIIMKPAMVYGSQWWAVDNNINRIWGV